jgi:predicted metalloprotease with PDZ domain
MAIGPYAWRDPMVTLSRTNEGALASEDFAGNIGNRILERFRVTLDYEHRRIWLEPGRRYGVRDAFTRTGLLLGWWPDHIEAVSVLAGSPAEKAGVQDGDRVTAIDGKAAGEWKLADLDAMFEAGPDGRRVTLTVNRDGKDVALTMVLREMLR